MVKYAALAISGIRGESKNLALGYVTLPRPFTAYCCIVPVRVPPLYTQAKFQLSIDGRFGDKKGPKIQN